MVSLMGLGPGWLGGTTPEGDCPAHPTRPRCVPSTRPVADVGRGHLAEVCLPGVPAPRCSLPCPRCPLGKGVTAHSPHLGSGEVGAAPRGRSRCAHMVGSSSGGGGSVLFLHQAGLSPVWTSIGTRGYLFTTMGCDPARLPSVARADPALAPGSSFRQAPCPSDVPTEMGAGFCF